MVNRKKNLLRNTQQFRQRKLEKYLFSYLLRACLRSPEKKKRLQCGIKNSVPASYLPPLYVIHVWMSLKYENDSD